MKRMTQRLPGIGGKDDWETPQPLFDALDFEFHFDLDPCANELNHKCDKWFSEEDDGLGKSWGGCRVYCNPPYRNIAEWVKKAHHESQKPGTLVVMLIPARTDTRWFHDYVYGQAEIRFIKGRIHFSGSKINAPFPSMVVIFPEHEV